MSRRKQSNPKPLKSDEPFQPLESTDGPGADPKMVTVLETPIQQKDTPERSSTAEEGRKSPTRPDVEEKPKIRLRLGLATDPAHNLLGPIKSELDAASQPTAEYLATLPPAIQSALASRGLLFPAGLNLNEAVVAMAAAQRAAASTEAVRAASVESVSASETSRTSVPIYQCVPCGIRFSSLSTLEAHQTYYCSHRPNKPSEDDPKTSGASSETVTGQSDADSGDPSGKALRTSKQYTCMHCSYSADKKVSLNRHMRMHTVSPGPATAPASSAAPLPNGELSGAEVQDRYCAECDIRFSSQKTYRAHKMHYCNSRHVIKPTAAPSSCTSSSSPTSPADPSACRTPPSPAPQQQPFLALPTNPIIIVPYALFRSASVLPTLSTPNGVPSPDTPCFLLPNGTLQPMTSALSSVNLPTQAEVLKAANKSNKEPTATSGFRETSSGPLDLTMRKSPEMKKDGDDADYDHEKENMKSPEKIECEPSIQSSPCSTHSPGLSSPKRKCEDASRSNSPRASKTPKLCLEKSSRSTPEGGLAAHFDAPPVLHPLLLRSGNISSLFPPELQMRLSDLAPLPPVMPQVIVKQGVSKCKECNIVFCKHENYLVHKKHYCFARPTEDDASKTSGSPPVSPRSGGTTSPAAQYQQLICLACGIKFTSPDNLNAHQQYYCLKRNETEREPKRCGKCRGILEPGHQCVAHSAVAGWKCPCCDIISATASAAQRHMETHTGVKAYRCTICKYKGNTLRGMKTHIRMHFDKRSPDLQEEKYIAYILEDDSGTSGMEVAIAPSLPTDEGAPPPNISDPRPDPHHLCPQCPYSSPYKANVVRHIKLVHDQEEMSNGEERTHRGLPQLEDDDEIIIKKEAMEPEVIIDAADGATIKEEPETSTTPKISKTLDEEIMQEVTKPGAHYCKSCDISFNYPTSFIAHKKFYCQSHAGEISSANNNNNTAPRTAETSVL
ncbi:zinc finger protein ush isoform X3 [Dendroctonus ponderosae]|uniref:zinc finger protein ush isoform X3 n=1 Tax=Dendroctonus ponderosae TaxID=77166 RepID=UPI002035565F|nr:zinc finger protein ush isoform X3 [Dendroctonus ponderosae]